MFEYRQWLTFITREKEISKGTGYYIFYGIIDKTPFHEQQKQKEYVQICKIFVLVQIRVCHSFFVEVRKFTAKEM